MEAWFGLAPGEGVPAIAREGQGVLETFLAASRAMLKRIVALAEPQTRRTLDAGDLAAQLDAAFAPYLARSVTAGWPARESARAESAPIVLAVGRPARERRHLERRARAPSWSTSTRARSG